MAEGLLSLAVAEPSDVVAANFERVGDGETVVDWHQTELIVAEFLDEESAGGEGVVADRVEGKLTVVEVK